MSIINQVLKDLESRKKEEKSKSSNDGSNSSGVNNGRGVNFPPGLNGSIDLAGGERTQRKKIWLLILIIFSLFALVLFWWINVSKKNKNMNSRLEKISNQQTKMVSDASEAIRRINADVLFQRATFNHVDNKAVLTLYFDRRPHFHFSQNFAENQLTIYIDKATSNKSISIPENDYIEKIVTLTKPSLQGSDNDLNNKLNLSKEGGEDSIVAKLYLYQTARLESIVPDQHHLVFTFIRPSDLDNQDLNRDNNQDKNLTSEPMESIGDSGSDLSDDFLDMQQSKETVVATITPEEQRQQSYQQALDFSHEGNQTAAISELKKILLVAPEFYNARRSLAIIYLQKGDVQNAITTLNAGLTNMPNDQEYIELLARALLMQDKLQEALDQLQKISPKLKSAPSFYALLAVTQQRLGNYLFAAEIYQQLVSVFPTNGAWWVGLGISLQAAGQNNAAIRAYEKGIQTKNLTPSVLAFAKSQLYNLGG